MKTRSVFWLLFVLAGLLLVTRPGHAASCDRDLITLPDGWVQMTLRCQGDGESSVAYSLLTPSQVIAEWAIWRQVASREDVSGAPWPFWVTGEPEVNAIP